MPIRIKSITAKQIINSNASYTLETKVTLSDGSIGISSVPGGLSKGKTEVASLPIKTAIEKIKQIETQVKGKSYTQYEIDDFLNVLDHTHNKSNLGGNTILSVSIAYCRAMSNSSKLYTYQYLRKIINLNTNLKLVGYSKPQMMMLIFEGGLHGSGKATIQEFMVIVNSIDKGIRIYNKAKKHLHENHMSLNVGAEGAFSPRNLTNIQVLKLLTSISNNTTIALDVAANSFKDLNKKLPNYHKLLDDFKITSIEDPYPEDSYASWRNFNRKFGKMINVVTDDLSTTNPRILSTAIEQELGNSIIIKPNQIGTISETIKVIELAKQNDWETIVSHRGTDTNDDLIADLAIAANADYVKFGAPARGERVAKYNRLQYMLDLEKIN